MNFLIDGHNLIGSNLFSDIHLSDEDDEAKLVMRLRVWQSRARGTITVIFDRGIPGGIDVKMGGAGLRVIFASDPAQADDLIRRRLRKANQGLVLVTNDEALLRYAAIYGVKSWRGVEFVERMTLKDLDMPEAGTESDVQVSKSEVDEWLALFRADRVAKRVQKQRSVDASAKPAPAKPTSKTAAPLPLKPRDKPPARDADKDSSIPAGKSSQQKRKGHQKRRRG